MTINTPQNIILSILAACAMASCVSDSSDPMPSASQHKVVFDISSLTRSTVTTADNVKGNSFLVYGDMKYIPITDDSESASETIDVFLNATEVRYDNTTSKWTYSDQKYWIPNAEHSFVAVHPYSAVNNITTKYLNNTLSFTYTLPDNFESTPDMVVATHRRMYQDKTNSPATSVKFKFFHILSRINIALKFDGSSDAVTVTGIELEGIDRTGTFSITPAPISTGSDRTDDYDLLWSDLSNKGNLRINIDATNKEGASLFPENNALFVIPQPENKNVILKIYCKIEGNEKEQTLTAPVAIGGWTEGKTYTYSLTLNTASPGINMSVSVENWQDEPGKEMDVPDE